MKKPLEGLFRLLFYYPKLTSGNNSYFLIITHFPFRDKIFSKKWLFSAVESTKKTLTLLTFKIVTESVTIVQRR